MENWEGLDVDDSDLPSLLRPCKRHHHNLNNNTTTTSNSQNFPSIPQSQTLICPQLQSQHSPPAQPQTSVSRSPIPGPAGAVQAAMLRRARADQRRTDDIPPPVSTQEYIRRAVENGGVGDEDDDDFKLNPWLCALEFLGQQGEVDCALQTCLSSITKFSDIVRVDRVVAIIKSCTPNGFGDLMVTLKDPTGKIEASIHRKVLADGEFGKEISVGSVLILQKVAVFAPSRSAVYLNITRSNVVKVISKDSGAPTKQYPHISGSKPTSECCMETGNVHNAPFLELERTQGIHNGIGQYVKMADSTNNNELMNKGNERNFLSRGDHNDTLQKEPLSVRQDAAEQIIKKTFRREIIGHERSGLNDVNKMQKENSLQLDSLAAADVDEKHNDDENLRTNGVQKQRQPLTSRVSLPEWTDEQLSELFAADFEDDVSLF